MLENTSCVVRSINQSIYLTVNTTHILKTLLFNKCENNSLSYKYIFICKIVLWLKCRNKNNFFFKLSRFFSY